MCYFIYGALYGDVYENEYKSIKDKYEFKIHTGTKHDVKTSVKGENIDFRVTDWCCDCDSDLGKGDTNSEFIKQYVELFNDIKNVNGAKHIYLCKTWTGKTNKTEVNLKLNEINLEETLANFRKNCLYVFEI